ncbi:unnamed protein product [Bemisia tabaci]|uniref:BHLH domain-containing protein n=1 Tax=Bemisia tabaci TaxID=7038 RepID=A0A9P0F869_BEMTA|nr:PREDICTED: basic helix-loop-helix transcription factor amos-like [Bemisia tabaci]CAH0393253.1 unnamed protein product [Bemisia tabaci]
MEKEQPSFLSADWHKDGYSDWCHTPNPENLRRMIAEAENVLKKEMSSPSPESSGIPQKQTLQRDDPVDDEDSLEGFDEESFSSSSRNKHQRCCCSAKFENSDVMKRTILKWDRERQRSRALNDAWDKLRKVLPSLGNDRRLTRLEAVQMAINYISALYDQLW